MTDQPAKAAEYLAQAAAVAKCRVLGEDALRLEFRAIDAARAHDDAAVLAQALARAAETIFRFEGMFAGPVPKSGALAVLAEMRALSSTDPLVHTAASVIEASRADPADPRCRHDAERAAEMAHHLGDQIRESAALDVLTGTHIVGGRPIEAADCARRRVDLLNGRPVEPAAALELKDALHMAVLACVGAGDLASASRYGERHRSLAFLREQRDLAIEPTLLPGALAGYWRVAVTGGDLFLEDWIAAGRPSAPGRAIGPCAVAMAHGLLGNHAEREIWLGVVAELRGVERLMATDGTGYGELFDAIVLLHQRRPDCALSLLSVRTRGQSGWYGPLLSQWQASLLAEAAVLATVPEAFQHCAEAERVCAGNALASALIQRARALAARDEQALIEIAHQFADAGVPYQAARTLVLAGGQYRSRGNRLLAGLGAVEASN